MNTAGTCGTCRECETEAVCGTTNWDCRAATCNECQTCNNRCGQAMDCGGVCSNADNGAPGAISCVSPNNGVTTTGTVPLTWTAGDSLTDYYQAEVYNGAGALEWSNNNVTPGSATSTNATGLLGGDHTWRARAVNSTCGTDPGHGRVTVLFVMRPWLAVVFSAVRYLIAAPVVIPIRVHRRIR